jgi:hypothetical protein
MEIIFAAMLMNVFLICASIVALTMLAGMNVRVTVAMF